MIEQRTPCDICQETNNLKAPCDECPKPESIHADNVNPWEAWKLCNEIGRDITGKLRIEALHVALDIVNGNYDDVERVLKLERIYQKNNVNQGNTNKINS